MFPPASPRQANFFLRFDGKAPPASRILARKLYKNQYYMTADGLWKKTFTFVLTGKWLPPINHTPTAVLLMSGHH